MHNVLLDANIYDRLKEDSEGREQLRVACERKIVRVVTNFIIQSELEKSPFGGIPQYFPVTLIADTVAIAGLAVAGLAIPGSGDVFSAHLGTGTTKHSGDAVTANTASNSAD